MFSPVVAQSLESFREIERYKKDSFASVHFLVNDDDSEKFTEFLRSQRWWLQYISWTKELLFDFYQGWRVPAELLRFANELFVEQEDLKEVQVVWDSSIRRFYLNRADCRATTDDDQMPICWLFKEMPEKPPVGIWGVCKRPTDLDNPYAYYGVSLYKTLRITEEISDSDVFC